MSGHATKGAIIGLSLLASAAFSAGTAFAQPAFDAPPPGDIAASPAASYRLPARTVVAVEMIDPIGTHETKSGDAFAIKLAAPVIVDGQVVLPAGTPGVGRVIQSSGPGMGGKGAKLVVSAEYLSLPSGTIPLQAMQLAAIGKDHSMTANVSSAGGLVFFPLGLVGFAVKGGDIEIPAGTAAIARTSQPVDLAPWGAATDRDYALVKAMSPPPEAPGSFVLPDPPRGMGQVVFFRQKTALGTGQWFNVRDDGEALGKLNNGSFFVTPVAPGIRQFTAKTEPEFKDALTLKIDPGETYFVEAVLTKGVIIGVPDLTPSDRSRFDSLSSQMQALAPTRVASATR